jgi:hypothetical protein
MVKGVLANPPCLDPCPNFLNLQALQSYFAKALKCIPCPQSPINRWSGAVLSPNMYAPIDLTPFHLNIIPKPDVANFPPRFLADGVTTHPYSHEEILTISAEFALEKNYVDTDINVFCAVFDTLNSHVSDAYKIAPATALGTIGWNSTMLPNEIFDQLMVQYSKPTPTLSTRIILHSLLPTTQKIPLSSSSKDAPIVRRS